MLEKITEAVRKISPSEFTTSLLMAYLLLVMTVSLHEGIHYLSARIQGCKAFGVKRGLFIGVTKINCEMVENPDKAYMISAISPSIFMALFGLYLWTRHSDDPDLRLWAIFSWLYSTLPSMAIWKRKTDFGKALRYGFPYFLGFIIFIFTAGITISLIREEIKT